ncbi:LAGLIDADG family homing endonuclease [Candidatus Omnitrophota bacterium]
MTKKLEVKIIKRSRKLRTNGLSFGEISFITGVPRSTLYGHLRDISLTVEQRHNLDIRNRERNMHKINPRKDKCLAGREIVKPRAWSTDLVHTVAHFMFDGRVSDDCCIYYSNSKYQINHMRMLLHKIFNAEPKVHSRDNNVYGLVFYHVELANYLKKRKKELVDYLNNGASRMEKRVFLKAFFDDEGNVFYKGSTRRVRGYQQLSSVLEQIKDLLRDFRVECKIDKSNTDIEITGQKNLLNFSKEINFSPKIYINHRRKNGIWKKRISKSKILEASLKSYKK